MANQKLFRPAGNTEGNVAKLFLEFPVGATGAVGTLTRSRGIGTVSRLGVGNYRAPLLEGWQFLLDYTINVVDATVGAADGTHGIVSVRTLTGASPLIEWFMYRVDTGAAADPRNGAILQATFELMNGQRV